MIKLKTPSPALAGRIALAVALSAALAGGIASAHWTGARAADIQATTPEGQTQAITDAANAFLASLSHGQQHVTQQDFHPEAAGSLVTFSRAGRQDHPTAGAANNGDGVDFSGEKYGGAVWSNYPIGGVPRAGLQLGFMSVAQRAAAMHMLQTALSPAGYRKVQDIMAADKVFASQGLPYAAGPDAFTLGIFGKPSATSPWMIEFTGHHLGLNIVIAGSHVSNAPTLTGAEPTQFTDDGHTVRVLADENDKAFALLNAFNDDQRKQAILSYKLADLVYGPGHDTQPAAPEGLKGSAMTAQQKAILLDLISQWAGMVNPVYSRERIAEIKADLDDTWFAWSGPTDREPGKNGAAYFRIQGPKLIIEFAPQTTDGDPRLHVHTIYRDPTNDYAHTFTM